jgi:hypothetical protein
MIKENLKINIVNFRDFQSHCRHVKRVGRTVHCTKGVPEYSNGPWCFPGGCDYVLGTVELKNIQSGAISPRRGEIPPKKVRKILMDIRNEKQF